MVAPLQMQDIARIVQYIQRRESYPNQIRNLFNASVSYLLNIKAVYLPGQRPHLLQQRYAATRAFIGIFGAVAALIHSFSTDTILVN
jgi:hypothetical protein